MNNTPTTAEYLESLQNDLNRITTALDLEEGTNFTDIAQMSEDGDIGGAEPNIFVQTTEPETKEGIWVQSNLTYDKIVIDNNVVAQFEWTSESKMANIPSDLSTYGGVSTFDDNDLFWFQGQSLYQYNFQSKQWSSALGTNLGSSIYDIAMSEKYVVLKQGSSNRRFRIYNRLNNTWTDQNYGLNIQSGTSMIIIGEYLYYFGYNSDTSNNITQKVNLTTGEFTTLTALSKTGDNYFIRACIYYDATNDLVYLFLDNKKVYRYSIANDNYTYLGEMQNRINPNGTNATSTVGRMGNYLYLPPCPYVTGSSTYVGRTIHRYNLSTNEDELIAEVQSNNPQKELLAVNYLNYILYDNAYIIFGGQYAYTDNTRDSSDRTPKTLSLVSKTYNQDSLVIEQGTAASAPYSVELYPNDFEGRFISPLTNVYLYNNNELLSDLPTYVGNGASWTLIKGTPLQNNE